MTANQGLFLQRPRTSPATLKDSLLHAALGELHEYSRRDGFAHSSWVCVGVCQVCVQHVARFWSILMFVNWNLVVKFALSIHVKKNIFSVVVVVVSLIFHSLFLDVKVKCCVVGRQQQHHTHAEAFSSTA